MKTAILKYSVILRKEGKDYVAYVPTLGISDFGKTVSSAKENVKNAISCHIEGLVKTKTEVPMPDTEDFYISQAEVPAPRSLKFALQYAQTTATKAQRS